MIDLPRALAPWRAALDLFAPDVAEGLGPLLPRLSLAVGPMRIARPTGDGEPDGFTGIARRGSYERLLLTEWLLADEAPLEFARRAATGEHAFFQIARRAPSRAMSSVALFDAGPDQLGAPRVAHLAALIVLAARAERAGARFAWGLLHQPDRALFAAVTKESVTSLLGGRTAVSASADDVAAWSDRAGQSAWEDAWIVGARAAVPGWKHGTIAVRDPLDPDRRSLAITARAPGAAAREAELELPPDRVTARLLRDPFSAPPAPPLPGAPAPAPPGKRTAITPISNLVFAPNGSKVFARGQTGEIIGYPTVSGWPKRYRPRGGGIVAAVGWVARGCVMVVIEPRRLTLEQTSRKGPAMLERSVALPEDVVLFAPAITDPLSPLAFVSVNGAEVYFADATGALFQIGRDRLSDVRRDGEEERTGSAFVNGIADLATAFAPMNDRFSFVGRGLAGEPPGAYRIAIGGWPASSLVRLPGDGTGSYEARVGTVLGSHLPLLAVEVQRDLWTIFQGEVPIAAFEPRAGARVVGPWRAGARTELPATLVMVEDDQRTITVASHGRASTLMKAPSPIVAAAICPVSPLLAFSTTEGELGIRSLTLDTLRLFPPKEVP